MRKVSRQIADAEEFLRFCKDEVERYADLAEDALWKKSHCPQFFNEDDEWILAQSKSWTNGLRTCEKKLQILKSLDCGETTEWRGRSHHSKPARRQQLAKAKVARYSCCSDDAASVISQDIKNKARVERRREDKVAVLRDVAANGSSLDEWEITRLENVARDEYNYCVQQYAYSHEPKAHTQCLGENAALKALAASLHKEEEPEFDWDAFVQDTHKAVAAAYTDAFRRQNDELFPEGEEEVATGTRPRIRTRIADCSDGLCANSEVGILIGGMVACFVAAMLILSGCC